MSLNDKLAAVVSRGRGSKARSIVRFLKPMTNEQYERRDELLLGIALATVLLGYLSLYLSLTGCLILLTALAICRGPSRGFGYFTVAVNAVTIIVAFYITLIQPLIGIFVGPILIGSLCSWSYNRRIASKRLASRPCTRWLSTFVVLLASALPSLFLYNRIYTIGIPLVHPYTVVLWNLSPFIYVVAAEVLTLYCVSRLQTSKNMVYRLVPGLTVLGFALLYPMHEAVPGGFLDQVTTGDVMEWVFALCTFALAFIQPSLMRLGGITVGTTFCVLFVVVQIWPWAYMSAVGMSMPVRYAAAAPQTINSRTMPLVVGQSSCPQGNTKPKTATGEVSIALNGSRFDFQCSLHYTSWIGTDPVLSLLPGSTLGVIRVDAGSKSGDVREVKGRFYFGENSGYYRAAVMARHPGATLGDYNYTEAVGGNNLKLAVSYTEKRLFWFAMVPAVGGSVVESQDGGFQDYTVTEAASTFPDFFQVPEDIVKLRAAAWAAYRNPMASAWSPDEISDTDGGPAINNKSPNHPPFGIALKTGPAWFVGLEPQGINATAMSYFMFFDARYGTANILDVSQASPKLKGLQDIQHLAPSVVTGNNDLFGIEPIPLITADGRCFYSVSVMGPHTEMRNKDFQGVAVFTCSGDKVATNVLDTSEKVDAAIATWPSARIGQPSVRSRTE